ncbi:MULTISPECIES: NUDIX hydrolase [Bacillaceae]|uniref:Nudix hydrolase domain-containing protein n=1 Tax=Alkalicoccobacillus plakortidis TaxID=444060 RepID=A0A9D5DPK4_9BACI|nr:MULTISPECIES: NUDIX hydrolase [Bacillaceae]KQL56171.1 hypothetical protein AN965_14700 [Alkalicoccobacillus plakortidis]
MIRQAVGAIIHQGDSYIVVCKSWQHTINGEVKIDDEWDIVKGGVEKSDPSLEAAILRELYEETGSTAFTICNKFDAQLHFSFPPEMQEKIGYSAQETTIFQVEFTGNVDHLKPVDGEISGIQLVHKSEFLTCLSHEEMRQYVKENIANLV